MRDPGNEVDPVTVIPKVPKTLTLLRYIVSYYVFYRVAKQCLYLFEQERPKLTIQGIEQILMIYVLVSSET